MENKERKKARQARYLAKRLSCNQRRWAVWVSSRAPKPALPVLNVQDLGGEQVALLPPGFVAVKCDMADKVLSSDWLASLKRVDGQWSVEWVQKTNSQEKRNFSASGHGEN